MWKKLWSKVSNLSIQLRTTLAIIGIVAVTVAASYLSSFYFTNQSLDKTVEQDLSFAIEIANSLVGTQMDLMKSEAKVVAEQLSSADTSQELNSLLAEQYSTHDNVLALEIFDRNGTIANYSEPLHVHSIVVTDYIDLVYEGETIISSPFYCATHGEYVMNVYTPLPNERVLAVTMPGQRFSDMLSGHRLWDTGSIFMLNGEGMFIGTADEDLVLAVNNYVDESKTTDDPDVQAMSDLIQTILSSDEGVTQYVYQGERRVCAYSRITSSALGWCVAVTVPLSESPQADAQEGQLYTALIFVLVGAIAALFLSRLLSRPFKRIEEQNVVLEGLNKTIKKQADSILIESERVHVMLDSTPLASRLWNRALEIIDCNDAAVKLFRLSNKQEYMDNYFNLAPEVQPDGQISKKKAIAMVAEAFESGRCVHNFTYKTRDGSLVPSEVTLVRVPYGDDYAVASYSRDLREEQKMIAEIKETSAQLEVALDDAEKANAAKTEFLAKMSHEIRTPLNAVIGLSELTLEEGKLAKDTETNLEKIYGAGSTILTIVNDILDISKIESGSFESNLVQYDTPSMINDTVSINIVRIGEKPIEFKLVVDENLPAVLFGDDLRVKQIFNNLLSNAFKYTNEGQVTWRLMAERKDDKVLLCSSVSDTGIGIKKDDLNNLFAEYSQVNTKTNRNVEGTGLGLSIAKRLVERMNGSISVQSEYGKGSTFNVCIYQDFVNDQVIGKAVAENLMSMRYALSKQTRNKLMKRISMPYARVLIVDDTETNLDVAKGMMKPYGMTIDCVKSGPEAIELIRAKKPHYDAIFMDHMMPHMDGIEATQIIREKLGTNYAKNIPIIALTANAVAGNEEMFLAHGFQAFLSKPVDIMRLDSILRKWVRKKDLEGKEPELNNATDTENTSSKISDATGDDGAQNSQRENSAGNKEIDEPELAEDQDKCEDCISIAELSISGLDIERGLEQFSDDEETYLEVLQTYSGNTRQLLDKLGDYLSTKNLKDYAVIVHGIKGSSYGICADEIGKAAEALEHAAKDYSLDTVNAKHPDFIKQTLRLLDDIDSGLMIVKQGKAQIGESETLENPNPQLLEALKAACESYDMDGVDTTIAELEKYNYIHGSKLVKWLRQQVDDMAFENISEAEWPTFD